MSEFHVRTVKLGKIEKHPNADTLSITSIDGAYPCILRTGEFQEGDLAAYLPIDSIVPDTEQFAFLQGHRRIKAKKLRGIFSMGMLTKLPPGNWKEGDNLQSAMGITKWEPNVESCPQDPFQGPKIIKGWGPIKWVKKLYYWYKFGRVTKKAKPPFPFPEYTDIEGLRKYRNVLQDGEQVVITEKVHGSNCRLAYNKKKLWVGSHHQWKGRPKGAADNFWQAVFNSDLEKKLQQAPGIAFYGEVYGKVQKGFGYDQPGGIRVRFFDAMNLSSCRYLDYSDFTALCTNLGLEMVPLLYKGPWSQDLLKLAEGKTELGGKHIREGFVVKPVTERFDSKIGRVILKMVSESYLLDKNS